MVTREEPVKQMVLTPVPELPPGGFAPPLHLASPVVSRNGAAWAAEFSSARFVELSGSRIVRVAQKRCDGEMFTNNGIPPEFSTCTVADYFEFLQEDGDSDGYVQYVEASIKAFAPEVAAALPAWCRSSGTAVAHIAPRGVTSSLHFDDHDGHAVQIEGTKKWILFPPDHAEILSLRVKHCDANPDPPDYERFPNLREARGMVAVLEPGDALYFPTGWFHKVRYLSRYGVSMTFFFEPKPVTG
jgi:hypothetical protein